MAKRPTMKRQPVDPHAPVAQIPKKIAPVLAEAGVTTAVSGYFTTDHLSRPAFTAWDKAGNPVAVVVRKATGWSLEKRS